MKRVGRNHMMIALAVAVCVVASAVVYYHYQSTNGFEYRQMPLRSGSRTITVQVADTPAKQMLGLGKRSGLAADKGMLFVYDQPDELCFWMKDMRFPIDMIWLDGSHKVIQVEREVSPNTYPHSYCAPKDNPATYVLEVASGQAARLGMTDGSYVQF